MHYVIYYYLVKLKIEKNPNKNKLFMMPADYRANQITTELSWDDLVLDQDTLSKIRDIQEWIKNNNSFQENLGTSRKPKIGYHTLFYGPSGTGKTLTASLLGKATNRDVYRIDLSMVISKYIGETEKNLSVVFDKAEYKNWIFFFDEADALFGKRTDVKDAHDRYANQEVSYLLQRIEEYEGLAILATNSHSNIDRAVIQRFDSAVYFPLPKSPERKRLWEKAIPKKIQMAKELNVADLAEKYELTGSNIMNIVRYASLQATERQTSTINQDLLEQSIKKELTKES